MAIDFDKVRDLTYRLHFELSIAIHFTMDHNIKAVGRAMDCAALTRELIEREMTMDKIAGVG